MCTLIELQDQQEFISRATNHILKRILQLQAESSTKIVKIGLSGGSTPGPIYSALATHNQQHNQQQKLDWSRILLFLIDDRFVPQSHKDSNQLLVKTTILDKLAASDAAPTLVFPETTVEVDVKKCVQAYGKQLEEQVGNTADIIILGMGPDGT